MKSEIEDLSDGELVKRLMPYTGHFAKPTIALFLISLTTYLLFSLLGALNVIPLWLTCGVNTLCAYLLFTPLHEASHQNIKGRNMNLRWVENTVGWISSVKNLLKVH